MREALTEIDLFLIENVAYPTLLSFLAGVIFVAYFIRPILWLRARQRAYDSLCNELSNLGATRSDFFEHLGKAYEHFRAGRQGLPENHNDLIDQIEYPAWLDGRTNDLSKIARANIEAYPNEGWTFVRAFCREIEEVRSGRTRHISFFDDREEHRAFHKERQTLVDFWNNVAKQYEHWALPAKKTLDATDDHWRTLKILAYFSVAVFLENNQTGPCASYLYKYARSHFVMDTEYGPRQISQP